MEPLCWSESLRQALGRILKSALAVGGKTANREAKMKTRFTENELAVLLQEHGIDSDHDCSEWGELAEKLFGGKCTYINRLDIFEWEDCPFALAVGALRLTAAQVRPPIERE